MRELTRSCDRLLDMASTQAGWKWHLNATVGDPIWAQQLKQAASVPSHIESVIVSVGNRDFDAAFWSRVGRQKDFHLVSKKVLGSFVVIDGKGIMDRTQAWCPKEQDALCVFSACVSLQGAESLQEALCSIVQKGRDFKCLHQSDNVRGEAFIGIGWGTMRNPQTSGGNWAAYKLHKYARAEADMVGGVVKAELLPLLGLSGTRTLKGADLPVEFHVGGLPGHKMHTTLNAQVKPHFDKRDLSGTMIFWHNHATPSTPAENPGDYTEGAFQLYSCFISALLGRASKICYVMSDVVLHGTFNHSIKGLMRFGSAVYCCKPDITRLHRQLRSVDLKGVCEIEWEEAQLFDATTCGVDGTASYADLRPLNL